MTDGMAAIFWGVVTFSLLIVIHEGGHFLTARWFGVKVHEFMIGLPGPAIRLHGKKTTYGITAIPLGGYVRIAGMEPGPEDPLLAPALASATRVETANAFTVATDLGIEETEADALLVTLADWDALEPIEGDDNSYRSRFAPEDAEDPKALLDRARLVTYRALPTWKRIIVLSAGVVLNLITAVLVFSVVVSIFGVYSLKLQDVAKGSAAAAAGIRAGDRVTALDGKRVGDWQALVDRVATHEAGDVVKVTYVRDGKTVTVTATLKEAKDGSRPLLGVSPSIEKPTPVQAVLVSVSYIGMTFRAIMNFFNPGTFRAAISQSSSIIGASYMAAAAARTSALNYAALVALLSLSLGVINIFPIPPLDGGKVAIEIFERLRGKPLSRKVSLALSATGAVLLFALIGYLMYADVVRFIIN